MRFFLRGLWYNIHAKIKYIHVHKNRKRNADENAGSILYKITVTSSQTEIAAHTYYLIIHVKADTTAQLNALSIIQKGEQEDIIRSFNTCYN